MRCWTGVNEKPSFVAVRCVLSIQFGRWNLDDRPVDQAFLEKVSTVIAPYEHTEPSIHARGSVGMSVASSQDFRTDRHKTQERGLPGDILLSWDGRLDNHDELARELRAKPCGMTTDMELVRAAYERWGLDCFGKLVGDWALAIWDGFHKRVVLARDFIGCRQLYFDRQPGHVTWCTVLDPLVYLRGCGWEIREEYLIGYLSTLPLGHHTPFRGISAVAAGTCVVLQSEKQYIQTFWKFDPSLKTRYRTDAEYEEHFRSVFRQAVKRRLRSDGRVFAELSGGMDSSSIVCMADAIVSQEGPATPNLETISYYDNGEPNWNESPFFALVERQRGQTGQHVNLEKVRGFLVPPGQEDFCLLPGRDQFTLVLEELIAGCMPTDRQSVLLSGLGGDEFLGGVPNPIPELQDLFVRFRWVPLLNRLSKWSLEKRRPWIHVWFETLEEFLPQGLRRLYKKPRVPPWIASSFRRKHRELLESQMKPVWLWAGPPSFQANLNTLEHITRQLNCYAPSRRTRFVLTYPYLDRDLLQFLFSIPRDQLLRPGQRRSLMRRSLSGLVPEEILQRRRKASVSRSPVKALQESYPLVRDLFRPSLVAERGIIDDAAFLTALEGAMAGEIDWLSGLIATVKLEQWLRSVQRISHDAPTILNDLAHMRGELTTERR